MLYNMTNVDIKSSFKSDHSPIKISFENKSNAKRGPGFWKFNSSLLLDADYCEYIRGIIRKYTDEYSYLSDHALK